MKKLLLLTICILFLGAGCSIYKDNKDYAYWLEEYSYICRTSDDGVINGECYDLSRINDLEQKLEMIIEAEGYVEWVEEVESELLVNGCKQKYIQVNKTLTKDPLKKEYLELGCDELNERCGVCPPTCTAEDVKSCMAVKQRCKELKKQL